MTEKIKKKRVRTTLGTQQIDLATGEVIATFHSQKEAEAATGVKQGLISSVVQGHFDSAGGFGWRVGKGQIPGITHVSVSASQIATELQAIRRLLERHFTVVSTPDPIAEAPKSEPPQTAQEYSQPAAEKATVKEPKEKRTSPRVYRRATVELVTRCLDLCALGHDNSEIAEELGLGPQTVSRIRSRSTQTPNFHAWIDAWRIKNPKANVHTQSPRKYE